MTKRLDLLFVATAFILAVVWCSGAWAQEPSSGYRAPGFYGASEQVGEEEEPDNGEHSFSWFTMVPSLGYAYFPAGNLSAGSIAGLEDLDLKVDARNAFVAKLHFDFGGDGIAVEMVPFLAVEAGGSGFTAASVDIGGGLDATRSDQFYVIGGQGNLVYRWKVGVFYPHLGLGGHLAYIMQSDHIDYGAELYGRVPLGFTIYLLDKIGLVVEGAFMFGATGIKRTFEPTDIAGEIASQVDIDLTTGETNQAELEARAQEMIADEISKKVNFGFGIAWEISIGIRFP